MFSCLQEGKSYCSRACRERDNLKQPCYVAPSTSGDSDSDVDGGSRRISQLKRHPQQQQSFMPSATQTTSRQSRTAAAASTIASSSKPRHRQQQQQQQQESVYEAALTSTRWPGNSREGIRAWAAQIPEHCEPDVLPCPAQAVSSTSTTVRPAFRLSQQRMAPPALSTCTTQPARTSAAFSVPSTSVSPPIDTPPRRYAESAASSTATMQTESIATPASDDPAPPTGFQVKVTTTTTTTTTTAGVLDGIAARLAHWGAKSQQKAASKTATPAPFPAFTVVSTTHAQTAWDDDELLFPGGGAPAVFDAKPPRAPAISSTSTSNAKPMWISSAHQSTVPGCGFGYGYWTGNAAGEKAAREMRRPVVAPAVGEEKVRVRERKRESRSAVDAERERELAFCQRGRKTARTAALRA